MNKSGNVIAHKALIDGVETEDNVSCQLPSVEFGTSEHKGAGIMGTIDLPSTGQVNSMTFSMSQKAITRSNINLAKPGLRNIELRFVKDVVTSDGQNIPEGTKIFITGALKKFDPGKVEMQSTMDGSAEFEVVRYRIVIEGLEVLLIDKLNYIYKVNGIDYMEKIRAALG